MAQVIQRNEATAKYRRIPILIYSDSDGVTPWAGSVSGVKAQLSFNGATEAASTNDIARVGGALHYVELTQGETNTDDGKVTARVAAATGRLEGVGVAAIVNYDPLAAGEFGTVQPELTSAPPVNNASPIDMLRWLYHFFRNKHLTTASADTIKRDDETTNLASATLADDGTTFTRGEYA